MQLKQLFLFHIQRAQPIQLSLPQQSQKTLAGEGYKQKALFKIDKITSGIEVLVDRVSKMFDVILSIRIPLYAIPYTIQWYPDRICTVCTVYSCRLPTESVGSLHLYTVHNQTYMNNLLLWDRYIVTSTKTNFTDNIISIYYSAWADQRRRMASYALTPHYAPPFC